MKNLHHTKFLALQYRKSEAGFDWVEFLSRKAFMIPTVLHKYTVLNPTGTVFTWLGHLLP